MQYVKNEYRTYTVLKRIHLGATGTNLQEGETVEYDGFTLRHAGVDTAMHSLRGAVKEGWIAPLSDAGDVEDVAAPTLGRAVVHGSDGNPIPMGMAQADNVDVGTLADVRPENAPATHVATRANEQHGKQMDVVPVAGRDNGSEGVEIARFKNSSKMGKVEVGDNTASMIQALDSKTSVDVERVGTPVRPAATTATPEPEVKTASDEAPPASEAVLKQIRQFIPSFDWDVKAHWSQRVKVATEKYADMPMVLNYILSVESESVRNQIQKRITEAG